MAGFGPSQKLQISSSDAPTRVIVHVDLDCFYCQVEQKRLNIPRETPVAVQQWAGLIAVNYAARAAGVAKRMMIQDAKKVCPQLVCVHVQVLGEHGAVDERVIEAAMKEASYNTINNSRNHGKACLERYRQASAQIFREFKSFFPFATLEKASIDEAYLDLTDVVSSRAAALKQGSRNGESIGNIVRQAQEGSVVPGAALDEQHVTDIRMAIAAHLTARLRRHITKMLDFTLSAGISHNKLLAKVASAMNKPDGQTVILHRAVPALMAGLPLRKIRNFGGKVGELLEGLGCSTAQDVQQLGARTLVAKCGDPKQAEWIARAAHGISDEPVAARDVPKSMLAAKSFTPTSDWEELQRYTRVLCEELAQRMADDSALHNRRPRNLVVQYRSATKGGNYSAGTSRSRSIQLSNGGSDVPTADALVSIAMQLLRKGPGVLPCNRIGIATTSFVALSSKKRSISGLFVRERVKTTDHDEPADSTAIVPQARIMHCPVASETTPVLHSAQCSAKPSTASWTPCTSAEGHAWLEAGLEGEHIESSAAACTAASGVSLTQAHSRFTDTVSERHASSVDACIDRWLAGQTRDADKPSGERKAAGIAAPLMRPPHMWLHEKQSRDGEGEGGADGCSATKLIRGAGEQAENHPLQRKAEVRCTEDDVALGRRQQGDRGDEENSEATNACTFDAQGDIAGVRAVEPQSKKARVCTGSPEHSLSRIGPWDQAGNLKSAQWNGGPGSSGREAGFEGLQGWRQGVDGTQLGSTTECFSLCDPPAVSRPSKVDPLSGDRWLAQAACMRAEKQAKGHGGLKRVPPGDSNRVVCRHEAAGPCDVGRRSSDELNGGMPASGRRAARAACPWVVRVNTPKCKEQGCDAIRQNDAAYPGDRVHVGELISRSEQQHTEVANRSAAESEGRHSAGGGAGDTVKCADIALQNDAMVNGLMDDRAEADVPTEEAGEAEGPEVDISSIAAAEQQHILHLIQLQGRASAAAHQSKDAAGKGTKKQQSLAALFRK